MLRLRYHDQDENIAHIQLGLLSLAERDFK
jgi:hypothetical protein